MNIKYFDEHITWFTPYNWLNIAYQIMIESNPITYPKGHGSEKFERLILKQMQDMSGNGYHKVSKLSIQYKPMPHSHGNNRV